jgi:hypothetical protein
VDTDVPDKHAASFCNEELDAGVTQKFDVEPILEP